MGMRITTGMMMNTYRFNLQGSTGTLDKARNRVMSQRKFDSYMEDPASATQAWRIRRAMSSNFDYQANNSDTNSRFNIAWTTMGVVNHDLEDVTGRFSTIRGENGAIGAGRQPLGKVLSETAETIIQALNSAKYGDHFVFSGRDEMNPPFTWSDDMKTLYYRGINVNAGTVKSPAKSIPGWVPKGDDGTPLDYDELPADFDRDTLPPAGKDDIEQAWVDYYKNTGADPVYPKPSVPPAWGKFDEYGVPENAKNLNDPTATAYDKAWANYYQDQADVKRLEALSQEHQYVDLGMGMKEEVRSKLVFGTAFDRSLPGINMLGGFGVDKDGDPKNIVLIMRRLGELFSESDPNSGEWAHDGDEEEAMRLLDKITEAHHRTTEAYSEVDTQGQFLQNNQEVLASQGDYLQEERMNLEQVDLADAITEFTWNYYCYSAALKIGTQLLGQSLIDYMS